MMTTLVLGIGNTLLRDEGCGVHVIRYLQKNYGQIRPDDCFLDGGTLSFTLARFIENTPQLIVVDAAELNAKPGTLKTFVNTHMETFLGTRKRSAHDLGLLDFFDIARLTDCLPSKRALIGIQPQQVEWGNQPSQAIAEAIPKAAERVLELMDAWTQEGDPHWTQDLCLG
jgi:hydrogenase maturation protease